MAKNRKPTPEVSTSSPPLAPNASSAVVQNSSPALVQNSEEFVEENLKGALLDWLKEQPLYQSRARKEQVVQENVVKDLADELVSVTKQTPNSDNIDDILLEEIKKYVQKFPVDPKQKSSQSMDELPMQILNHLKSLQLFQDISLRHDWNSINKNIKKKAAVILLEDVANWVESLPIETGTEEDKNTKEQLESKLIHKIGELNMNSEIFNDDFIYDDILGDEVENLLSNIPGEDIKNNLLALKKDLLAIVQKARKKIRDENAGQIYKQQLCDTVSKTLPTFDLSLEGKASFEVLKDDVADAFINMYYGCNDKEETNKLKKKINDKIHAFCSNYLKRCPATPIDTTKLNDAMYNALKSITEPQNESFTDDIELVKIKEVINDCVNDLPLKNNTGNDKLHTNKMVSVLAKKIHEIEHEKELISATEYEEKMKKETTKFLKKLSLTTENDDNINEMVEKIVKNLKDTEESRKLIASTRNSNPPPVIRESKAKLRISFNDVSVSPCPVDTCSQTSTPSKCPGLNQCLVQKSSSVQTPCKKMQAVGSQINVTPNVVVNEYHWDSIEESSMQQPRVPCPCPTATHPPYVVMPQPIQSSTTTRRDESCMQTPRACCPDPAASLPPYSEMAQRPQSPVSRGSECTPANLESCLTTQPFPLQPFENKFIKPRDPDQTNPCNCAHYQIQPPLRSLADYDYDHQFPENPAAYRHELQAESTQAEKQRSNQSFGPVLDRNYSYQTGLQNPAPYQLPRTPSPGPPYPYHLSTAPAPNRQERSPQRNRIDSQSNQYPRQPCPCSTSRVAPGHRIVQESQYIPYTQCPGSPQMRNRQSRHDHHPMSSSPAITSCPPHFTQGQPFMSPRNSIPYSASQQMPCTFNTRSPCYVNPEHAMSPEEYEAGLNCPYQKSATHLGTFDDDEPQSYVSSYQDWGKARDDFEYWETDRQHIDTIDADNHRDGRGCKACKQRYGEYNGRHFS